MKKLISRVLLLFLLGFAYQSLAQVHYSGCSATGTNASAIGKQTTASGNNSLAGGYTSQATGSNSLAFGYNSKATQSTTTAIGNTATASGVGSMALGNYVKATTQNAFVIGTGTTASYPLTNSTANSIALGINSNKPTMLITKSLNNNYTGKVCIGPITTPEAKLHIRSDGNEDAGVMIEPSDKKSHQAFIHLFDSNHHITVDATGDMELNAGKGILNLQGNHYCFGPQEKKKMRLYTNDRPSFYVNVLREKEVELRDGEGSSFAIDFDDAALSIRTALYQTPRGSIITNWKDVLFLCTDGKIGLGTKTTYVKNDSDKSLEIHAPQTIELESGNITLSGKIGINTTNTVNDYALAVNGGIISTKVYIKEVKQWPDYVFSDDYPLMGLEELKNYLDDHQHLPGLPSEKKVLTSGYDLNEMQSSLLQKIEELTRYILLLQDEINELKSQKTLFQDSIVFTYDSNGNRSSRNLIFERIVSPQLPTAAVIPSAFSLFPNPTPGEFCLQANESDKTIIMHATLLSVSGSVLEEKHITGDKATFNLSNQPNGIYLLEVDGPHGHETWKVIKN